MTEWIEHILRVINKPLLLFEDPLFLAIAAGPILLLLLVLMWLLRGNTDNVRSNHMRTLTQQAGADDVPLDFSDFDFLSPEWDITDDKSKNLRYSISLEHTNLDVDFNELLSTADGKNQRLDSVDLKDIVARTTASSLDTPVHNEMVSHAKEIHTDTNPLEKGDIASPPDDELMDITLELAAAYFDLNDETGTRRLLAEVIHRGNSQQQQQAQQFLLRLNQQ